MASRKSWQATLFLVTWVQGQRPCADPGTVGVRVRAKQKKTIPTKPIKLPT